MMDQQPAIEQGQAAPRKQRQRKANGNGTAIVPIAGATVALGSLQAATPAALVEQASAMATALKGVIDKQNLYSTIKGKRYVKVEGWQTLGTMLGVLPREVSVTEEWGVYTATVELVRMSDGAVLSRASAECGDADEVDENGLPTWANRPRYSRRSMALTRATGKACRLAFSWIMALAGYEACPSEEMPSERPERRPAFRARSKSEVNRISPERLGELRKLMREAGADEGRFCAHMKIKSIAELEASRFDIACSELHRKLAASRGQGAAS